MLMLKVTYILLGSYAPRYAVLPSHGNISFSLTQPFLNTNGSSIQKIKIKKVADWQPCLKVPVTFLISKVNNKIKKCFLEFFCCKVGKESVIYSENKCVEPMGCCW